MKIKLKVLELPKWAHFEIKRNNRIGRDLIIYHKMVEFDPFFDRPGVYRMKDWLGRSLHWIELKRTDGVIIAYAFGKELWESEYSFAEKTNGERLNVYDRDLLVGIMNKNILPIKLQQGLTTYLRSLEFKYWHRELGLKHLSMKKKFLKGLDE